MGGPEFLKTHMYSESSISIPHPHATGLDRKIENCGGGFYACRVAILEKLNKIKRQASVLSLRFITGEYAVPLGVWCMRSAARKALENKPIEFASKDLMLNYAKILIKRKFGYDLDNLLKESIILDKIKSQSKITDFT